VPPDEGSDTACQGELSDRAPGADGGRAVTAAVAPPPDLRLANADGCSLPFSAFRMWMNFCARVAKRSPTVCGRAVLRLTMPERRDTVARR
jgi:hypothetical protein